jgi:pimeloyl-ACP methyl ester carboxylesterase
VEFSVAGARAYAYSGGRPFDATRPVVAFLHGGAQDHSVWILQSRYLAYHGYGVLAPDLPGHGRSGGAPVSRIAAMADWTVALLDAAGVRTAALVGHSMGSLVALDCAARHPERVTRIALLGTAFPMRVSPALLEAARDDEPAAQRMINVWSHSAYVHYPGNPGPGFWVIGENLRLMQRQKPGVLHADFAACDGYADGLELAARIRCPALLLLGERDAMTPAQAAASLGRTIPGAKSVLLEDCGHSLMAEKPDAVLEHLVAFLEASPHKAALP